MIENGNAGDPYGPVMPDPIDAQDALLRKAAEAQSRRDARAYLDYSYVLSSPEGRRVLQGILEVCRYDMPLPYSEGGDTHYAMIGEGMRRVGLLLAESIKSVDPAVLTTMAEEFAMDPE